MSPSQGIKDSYVTSHAASLEDMKFTIRSDVMLGDVASGVDISNTPGDESRSIQGDVFVICVTYEELKETEHVNKLIRPSLILTARFDKYVSTCGVTYCLAITTEASSSQLNYEILHPRCIISINQDSFYNLP